jgi:hypothetical protein
MFAKNWYPLGLASLLVSCGVDPTGSGPGPTGPTELRLSLKNVNVIPGTTVELLTAAGTPKAYRVEGGSETTGPITLNLGGADLLVVVRMERNEELRIRPKRGATDGAPKACRRRGNTDGASAEVQVADLAVSCVGNEWDTQDQTPTSDCTSPVVFYDDFTTGSQWNALLTGTGTGFTHTVSNNATGGNPGGHRRMSHTFQASSSIVVNHVYTGGSYDPRVAGAIRHLHYFTDRIQFDPGLVVGDRFRIFQGTGSFQVPVALDPANSGFGSTTWESIALLRLTPASFSPATANFTATGGVLTFGYQRSNTNSSTTSPRTTNHGIDNWTVVICH